MCGGRIVDTTRTFEFVLQFVGCVTVTVSPNQIIIIIIIITLDGVGYSRSQHPRTRLSLLSWETRSGCSAFETGLIRAGVLRRCTKSVE